MPARLSGDANDGLRVYFNDDDDGVILPQPPGTAACVARHQKHSVDCERTNDRASLTVFW